MCEFGHFAQNLLSCVIFSHLLFTNDVKYGMLMVEDASAPSAALLPASVRGNLCAARAKEVFL